MNCERTDMFCVTEMFPNVSVFVNVFSYLQSEEEKRLYEGKAMEADAMAANFAAESEKK